MLVQVSRAAKSPSGYGVIIGAGLKLLAYEPTLARHTVGKNIYRSAPCDSRRRAKHHKFLIHNQPMQAADTDWTCVRSFGKISRGEAVHAFMIRRSVSRRLFLPDYAAAGNLAMTDRPHEWSSTNVNPHIAFSFSIAFAEHHSSLPP